MKRSMELVGTFAPVMDFLLPWMENGSSLIRVLRQPVNQEIALMN